jgi:hypothetical protein
MPNNEHSHSNQNLVNTDFSISKENESLISPKYISEANTNLSQSHQSYKTKRQFTGFVLMAIGAFLGFISCILTVLNPFPEFYSIILYGLKTLAITIIFWGLYFVFE